ncbi:MAG TPA: hypothetical protein VK897_22505 [Anaerolineales bacterium]|nr:hypothetical protein [Anaerolineales bacterium]
MWEAQVDKKDKDVHKIRLFENQDQILYEDVIRYWRENPEFRDFYVSILKDSPFEAFFWENPPLTRSSITQAYEFVLVNSPHLSSVHADPRPFSQQFNSQPDSQNVIKFQNIGGDAELVAPRPIASESYYSHFAIFLRQAPAAQVHELFVVLADTLKDKIGDKPIWVSTSGLGVYWLHLRIDQRPKYYTYQPYKR